jgi:hypothetical protein
MHKLIYTGHFPASGFFLKKRNTLENKPCLRLCQLQYITYCIGTQQRLCSGEIVDSCSGGAWFESRLGHRLYPLRFLLVLIGPYKKVPGLTYLLGHENFPPDSFIFFILEPSYHSTLIQHCLIEIRAGQNLCSMWRIRGFKGFRAERG